MKNYRVTARKTPSGNIVYSGSEDQEQQAIFAWAEYMAGIYPELKLMYHVPNGGKRNAVEAAKFKRMGVKAGVPDIVIPIPRGKYHGAFIELKVGSNTTSDKQKAWLNQLWQQGYYTIVCYGSLEAEKKIIDYLEQKGDFADE